jgi:hypothetical protein
VQRACGAFAFNHEINLSVCAETTRREVAGTNNRATSPFSYTENQLWMEKVTWLGDDAKNAVCTELL